MSEPFWEGVSIVGFAIFAAMLCVSFGWVMVWMFGKLAELTVERLNKEATDTAKKLKAGAP